MNKNIKFVNVDKKKLDRFIKNMAIEVIGQIDESDEDEIAKMKVQIYEFISSMKTKEDLEQFIKDNKAAMEGIRSSSSGNKAKKYLVKIWEILCYVVKFSLFTVRNITSLAILASVIFICVKFEVTPIQAITTAYEGAKVIYKAADVTLTSAKKATDAYGKVQDTSTTIGDKIGSAIGTAYQGTVDQANKVKKWFKK